MTVRGAGSVQQQQKDHPGPYSSWGTKRVQARACLTLPWCPKASGMAVSWSKALISNRQEFVVTVRGSGKCPEAAKRPSRTLSKLGNQAGPGPCGSDTPLVP